MIIYIEILNLNKQVDIEDLTDKKRYKENIDLILDKNGILNAFEIKWSDSKKIKLTKSFSNLYPNHTFHPIHKGNFTEILTLDMIN